MLAGCFHIGISLLKQRVVFEHHFAGGFQRGGDGNLARHYQRVGIFTGNALIVSPGVLKVGLFGQKIVTRLGQASFRLIVVSLASYSLGGAQAYLVKYTLVIVQVVFRQFYHLLAHQHIKIALDCLQGGAFTGIHYGPGARVYRCFLTRDLAGGRKAIEDVLRQVNSGFAAVQVA